MNTNRAKVEKMVNGGYGLARGENGRAIFLRNSLEGETVLFNVFQSRKNSVFGVATSIVERNEARIEPPCPYYGRCGGCNLQHCNYDEQLRLKTCIITEMLQQFSTKPIKTIIASPLQYGYRQRIRLKIEEHLVGFRHFRSTKIVEIDSCLIAHPLINRVLGDIKQTTEFTLLCSHSEEVEFLYNPARQQINCLFHFTRKPRPADRNAAVTLVENTDRLESIFFSGDNFSLEGPLSAKNSDTSTLLFQDISGTIVSPPYRLGWEVGGFCQVNLEQNCNMIDYVLHKCGDVSGKKILDLFCGMGNFSIALARLAGSLLGIEGQGSAIRSAKRNSSAARLSNTSFQKGPIHAKCKVLAEKDASFDIIVLDPPRQGIPGLANDLHVMSAATIIYISCDPATLGRDVRELCGLGYSVDEIQPFDMFPQTHHIETVVVLKK